MARGSAVALSFVLGVACQSAAPNGLGVKDPAASVPSADPLAALRVFENAARRRTDFAHAPTSDTSFGTDPYVIRSAPPTNGSRTSGFVGLLRGRGALVELDESLREIARLPAPESPTGLAVATNGEVFVVGELSNRVARYRRIDGMLAPAGSIDLPGVRAMRDVATGPEGVVYVVEEHDGRLLTVDPGSDTSAPIVLADAPLCHGPFHVMRTARAVLVDCLLDHTILIRVVDRRGLPGLVGETRIVHDGPMWGMDAVESPNGRGLLVAVGGVEDHPLDRTEGSFGFVDSFVTLYDVDGGQVVKLSEVNTSALRIVTPKAVRLSFGDRHVLRLAVAGYGSDQLARLDWDWGSDAGGGRVLGDPVVHTWPLPPGSRMMDPLPDGSFVIANPLLDAWVRTRAGESTVVHVEDAPARSRDPGSRLGEALFFTTLMAPWNRTDGRLSRFTCETCHFEGYVDGRTHHTGRGDVHATTKPLLGLFSNRPYFSRALDPDLTTMVNSEFEVAGAKSDRDPWFWIHPPDFPWLKELSVRDETFSPEALRGALMTFLMAFTHRPNPSVVGRTRWTDLERGGAGVFRDRCEGCHAARLVADDPLTRVPFEMWEENVMSREGAIVWGKSGYAKTGVLPYVSEQGARVVSLRRLYKKYPYFTNGSAKGLASVLEKVRVADGFFVHDGSPDSGERLREGEKAGLAAFLDLL